MKLVKNKPYKLREYGFIGTDEVLVEVIGIYQGYFRGPFKQQGTYEFDIQQTIQIKPDTFCRESEVVAYIKYNRYRFKEKIKQDKLIITPLTKAEKVLWLK